MEKNIILKNGSKEFNLKDEKIIAIDNVNLKIETGKMYVIMGHSGSGKSTLIQILGLLDNLSDGELYINGQEVSNYSENEKAELRMKEIGFVFQSFYLNPKLTAIENVMLPMYINKDILCKDRRENALNLLTKFGLEKRVNHYPKELSGGEQQRIAIARALANNPSFILADEPTGNLDVKNEEIVYNTLRSLTNNGKAVVVVSHNDSIKKYADKVFYMNLGKLSEEI
ncbi:MAG: ABC transporter ATP-binding protein [Clostridia bacterium]